MTSPTAAAELEVPRRGLAGRLVDAGREQAVVASGQAVAGLGNLAFVAVAARILEPGAFGRLAAFVALHTALHLPGAGLAASGAFDPARARRLERRCATAGWAAAAVLAAWSAPIGRVLDLPTGFVLALAATAPIAPLLGLRRGLAYGGRRHGTLVRSLVAEPVTRCSAGLALAVVAGATGAAWGVVAGGWISCVVLGPARRPRHAASPPRRAGGVAVGVSFTLLALLQHLDLVVANGLLDDAGAASFATLSTVGGLVAFATATLPLVLLAPTEDDEPTRLALALGAALAVGAGAVGLALVAPGTVIEAVVGDEYLGTRHLLAPYLGAMAALGIARVLAAHHACTGRSRRVAVTLVGVTLAFGAGLALFGRTEGTVVAVSTTSLGLAALALAVPSGRPHHAPRRRPWSRARDLDVPFLAGLFVAAVGVRVVTTRSLWIDEATTVAQARMPFWSMLDDLRRTDVHPPLHHVVLWATTRLVGTGELAIRAPSILAGALTVPAAYGLAREAFDRRSARVVAVLAVPAPFLVWYSQEARMYALFMLAGTLAVWAQLVALRTGRTAAYVAWALAAAAMVWSQWFGLLPLAVQVAATVVAVRRRAPGGPAATRWRGPLVALGVLVVALVPLVPLLADQLAEYAERGAGLSPAPSAVGLDASGVERATVSVYAVVANGLWAVTGYHADGVMEQLGALWPLAMLMVLAALGRHWTGRTKLVAGVAVLPALGLFAIGYLKRDLFELRYFALLGPLLLVLAGRVTSTLARTRASLVAATTALAALSVVALVDQQLNGANPRLYDFRGAVHDIVADAGPTAEVALEPEYLHTVVHYYGPDLDTTRVRGLDASRVGEDGIDVIVTERFIGSQAASALVGRSLYELEQRFGPPERIERPNVIVWRFR
ncbi:MAG: glycosyltransferase family 39 protein [Acidimicrobiia bacterium]